MSRMSAIFAVIGVILVLALPGCGSSDSGAGEHSGEAGEHSGEAGEESGTQFALQETFDGIRAGARLVLSYDASANEFTGTVQNTTSATLRDVRVEVHLSNGVELGPTPPVDLAPGQVADVNLRATGQSFNTWSAHPEVGHGGGSESGEHSGESG